MRTIAIISALVANLHAVAQQWCPPGAEWSFAYSSVNWSTGETQGGVLLARYTGDSLVGGYTAQRIEQNLYYQMNGQGDFINASWGRLYTRYAEDVVFLWQPWLGQYDTLLWYGAVPGQSWIVPNVGEIVVLDTATVAVAGELLRMLTVRQHMDGQPTMFVDTLHERVGFDQLYLLPDASFTPYLDGPINGLICYRDQEISYSRPGTQDCGFAMSIDKIASPPSLTILPNPGSEMLWVERPEGMRGELVIQVRDVHGGVIGNWTMKGVNLRIDAEQWSPGLYLIELTDGQVLRSTAKWMKG